MSTAAPSNRFIIVRHGAISSAWKGVCYGCQDVPLCDRWMAQSDSLVRRLALLHPTAVFHSGLSRSRWLAERVRSDPSNHAGKCELVEDWRLRERNFGEWEGKTWDDVYASDPDNFHDLIYKPDTYRPPSGETTTEMQRRVVLWYQDCNQRGSWNGQTVIAITHSGPIAALAGHLLSLTPEHWSPWMLSYGEILTVSSQTGQGIAVDVKKGWQPDMVG